MKTVREESLGPRGTAAQREVDIIAELFESNGKLYLSLYAADREEAGAHYEVARWWKDVAGQWGLHAKAASPLSASTFGLTTEVERDVNYYRHDPSGEVYAIRVQDEAPCGPLPQREVTAAALEASEFEFRDEDIPWARVQRWRLLAPPYPGDAGAA